MSLDKDQVSIASPAKQQKIIKIMRKNVAHLTGLLLKVMLTFPE